VIADDAIAILVSQGARETGGARGARVAEPVRLVADTGVSAPASESRSSAADVPGPPGSSFGSVRSGGSARHRILGAARDLFCSHGYERTPLRAVSDSLGVTKAAIYYHFKAKEELLVAIVGPLLDRIDVLIDSAGPRLGSSTERRAFLAGYVDQLTSDVGIVAILLRDPGVGEHFLGQRFASQHNRMRILLGAGDEPASVIRTAAALRALELAVVEFGEAHPRAVRETALDIAISVLESGPGAPTPG